MLSNLPVPYDFENCRWFVGSSNHNTILYRAGAGAGRRHRGGDGSGQGHHRKLHEAAAPLPGGGRCGHEEPNVSVAVLLL